MTFLNHISRFLSRLGFVSLLGILSLTQIRAADTDLFITGAGGQSSRPNVLILLDNTANWGPMFGAEKAALQAVLSGLDPGLFNIGLMMYVETGNGNDNKDGSYVRFAIRPIDNKDDGNGVVNNASEGLIKTIADLDELGDRSNNAVYGLAMNEAYKYFAQGLSYSQAQVKRDYKRGSGDPAYVIPVGTDNYHTKNNAFGSSTSFNYQIDPQLLGLCKENHIIVISNGKGNDNASATKLATDLLAAAGGDTSELTLSPNGYQSNVADEWARFMSRDPKSGETNKPVIYTHAILVEAAGAPAGQYPADWPVLLKNMSVGYGKGSYYHSDGTESSIKAALESAFKEIQATASVFASSALPINTTVRGTFLNQVYMGVFRPEANAAPRWTGNLKLYKVAATTGTSGQVTSIFLAGQDGNSIEDQTTGFTKTLAQSYWTSASDFWNQDFASRFYNYAEIKGGGGASDLPDGELVEKGGAAQQLRASYSGETDKELSGRKLYTHLPGNTEETLDSFDTSLSASYFDLSGSVNISSMTRSGSTVTVNTSPAHGFATGDLITIGGVTPADYNLTAAITKISDTSFTYTITEQPVSPATTPPFQASLASTSPAITVVSIERAGSVATVNAPTHGLISGDRVEISGAIQPEYNVTAVISRVDADRFTYVVEETPSTSIALNSAQVCPAATGQTACPVAKSTLAITAMARTAGDLTVTVAAKNHGFSTGNIVLIEGVSPSVYTGQWSITKVDKDTFTYTGTWPLGPKTPADAQAGGISAKKAAPAVTVTSLVRSGITVIATTSAAHGFVVGNSVAVSGATQTQYNGTFAVIAVTATPPYTFQYTIVTSPGVPTTAWGTASKAEGNIQKDELVKWVRGENRLQDDNPDLSSTALVRGHLHGDVLHSRPVIVNYNRASAPPPTSDPNSLGRDIVVYYGANDGFLHAVKGGRDASDGVEKWAYIASDHMHKLKTLYAATPSILKKPDMYYFDGSISTFTKDSNDDGRLDNSVSGAADVAWLYATMRRGGRGIHSFDVTDPAATPTLLWKKSNESGGYKELGQTWSEVTPILIPGSSGPREAVVFNLGYDADANDPAVNTTGQTDTSGTSSRQRQNDGARRDDCRSGNRHPDLGCYGSRFADDWCVCSASFGYDLRYFLRTLPRSILITMASRTVYIYRIRVPICGESIR